MDKTTFTKGKVSGREIIFARCMGKKGRVYGFMVSIRVLKVKVGSVDTLNSSFLAMLPCKNNLSPTHLLW